MKKICACIAVLLICVLFNGKSYPADNVSPECECAHGFQLIKMKYIDNDSTTQKYLKLVPNQIQYGRISTKPLKNAPKESDNLMKEPFYGKFKLGADKNNFIAFAIYESDKSIKGYDTLLVGVNSNGELTDNTPMSLEISKTNKDIKEVTFDVPIKHSNGKESLCKIMFNLMNNSFYTYRVISLYEGEVVIDNELYLIALYDGNNNGIYNEPGDFLIIRKHKDELTKNNVLMISPVISFNNILYSVEASESGDEIHWSLYSKPSGKMKINFNSGDFTAKIDYLEISPTSSKGKIIFKKSANTELNLPADSFTIPYSMVTITDTKKSNAFQLVIQCDKQISITKDKLTELSFGQPFKASVHLFASKYQLGQEMIISKNLIGNAGETYLFSSLKGKEEAERMKVVLEDEKGNSVEGVKPRFG